MSLERAVELSGALPLLDSVIGLFTLDIVEESFVRFVGKPLLVLWPHLEGLVLG